MGLNRVFRIVGDQTSPSWGSLTGTFSDNNVWKDNSDLEFVLENNEWVLRPKLGETLMAKAKIDFNKETQPIDQVPERLAQLITAREKAIKDKETAEMLMQSLMSSVFQVMPIGLPFNCGRCKFEGYTVDFLTLANSVCPNCKTEGYIKLRQVLPSDFNKDERLANLITDFKTITTWFESLDEKPVLPRDAIQSANATLRAAGLLK